MTVSRTARQMMKSSSWIRRMFEEGAELQRIHGADKVFDLSLGNPLLDPPPEFTQALQKIAEQEHTGLHRYMPNAGFLETRAAIAQELQRESGLDFTANEIIMTVGAAGAINVALKALIDPGDEVVLLAPYFAEYVFYVRHANGVVHKVDSDADFLPDLDELRSVLNERTKAIIINSPNNPTGVIYQDSLLAELAAIVQESEQRLGAQIYLISDEPYRKLIYSDSPYSFAFNHHPRTVVATSHSKDLGLAGERIGYLALNPADEGRGELFDACVFMLRTLGFVNAPAILQRAVANIQRSTVDIGIYRRKRDLIHSALTRIGYECILPDGGFYLFPKSPTSDDVEFVDMLKEHLILVVPGSGFGTPGYFRVSYCVEDSVLQGSISGFAAAFNAAKAI